MVAACNDAERPSPERLVPSELVSTEVLEEPRCLEVAAVVAAGHSWRYPLHLLQVALSLPSLAAFLHAAACCQQSLTLQPRLLLVSLPWLLVPVVVALMGAEVSPLACRPQPIALRLLGFAQPSDLATI